ncbi:ATP-binding cassette domain-containing protein [Nocardioides lijunqiniae]|uniref:ATP-binding cassette domain-containing protein n=1 Tax=Nocardioides lijunqiniae TaxID=2760832 RepID=UPI001877A187
MTQDRSQHQGRHERDVRLSGVRHHFSVRGAEVPALDRTELTLEPGELVTLAGPSGCGKTTLLRLVAGFMTPSEGQVLVGGAPVRGPAEERGVVFQQPTLFPWLTVRRNVELGPRLRGVPMAERRRHAEEFLDLVGLADFAEHRPYELSGGMQQRCQIARVLANDPDIVLMDEPFGALDALTRERLQDELLEIWRRTGKTILFITHSVDEAVFLGSRVLVMSPRPGRIVLDEPAVFGRPGEKVPPSEIRALPEFVALRERVRVAIQSEPAVSA